MSPAEAERIRFRFRFRWHAGAHVHVRVFAGPEDGTLGKAGDLCFREDEWAAFIGRLDAQVLPGTEAIFEVMEEDESPLWARPGGGA